MALCEGSGGKAPWLGLQHPDLLSYVPTQRRSAWAFVASAPERRKVTLPLQIVIDNNLSRKIHCPVSGNYYNSNNNFKIGKLNQPSLEVSHEKEDPALCISF